MRTLGATRGRSKTTVGRVREKLAALLLTEGFDVDPFDLRWADGQNSHVTEDCVRWDTYPTACMRTDSPPTPPGVKVYIYSWDTMTSCARYGIVVDPDADIPWRYQVHSREG